MEKSLALHNYLLDKNYTIITTMVPVGDVVEYAVDWVVDLITVVTTTLGLRTSELDRRLTSAEYNVRYIFTDLDKIKTDESLLPYLTLGDYYDLKFTHDKEIITLIGSITDPIKANIVNIDNKFTVYIERLIDIERSADNMDVSFNFALVNLGGRVSNLESDVGTHKNIFQQIAMFINDPVRWAYELFEEIIGRFW